MKAVAFLRAINVGGHTVKMDRLRGLFEQAGLAGVETFIASGNVIFETRARSFGALEKKLEAHLARALGYDVATFIRSTADLAAIESHRAFPAGEAAALYIGFLQAAPATAAVRTLMGLQSDNDAFHVHGREVYWRCRSRFSDSTFSGAALEKALGMPATMRNVTTVRKLAARYDDS